MLGLFLGLDVDRRAGKKGKKDSWMDRGMDKHIKAFVLLFFCRMNIFEGDFGNKLFSSQKL